MLPLALLHAAQGKPMLVELKNGETFNGHLVACDNFMNLTLKEAYETSADGEQFWKMEECYLRGSMVKYIRVAEDASLSILGLDCADANMLVRRSSIQSKQQRQKTGNGDKAWQAEEGQAGEAAPTVGEGGEEEEVVTEGEALEEEEAGEIRDLIRRSTVYRSFTLYHSRWPSITSRLLITARYEPGRPDLESYDYAPRTILINTSLIYAL